MPEQDDAMIITVVIGLVVLFTVLFVLTLLCGLFGLILVVPEQANLLDTVFRVGMV